MRKNILLIAIFIVLTVACSSFKKASVKEIVSINHETMDYSYIIPFDYNSIEFNDSTKSKMDMLGVTYSVDSMQSKYQIVLTNFSCLDEIEKNPFIGVNRAQRIIEYLEKKYSFRRDRFYIVDTHIRRINDKECYKGTTGIEVRLIVR